MNITRSIQQVMQSQPTLEGAGVHLRRAFGFHEVPLFDPFLLLDDFRSDTPAHFIKGFPWHPHRGIETITYVIRGSVEHGDSLGNSGVIHSGDVQWMTAGRGIIHQEMPKGDPDGFNWGFQLWANLPKSSKMMDPRYRDVTSKQIPEVVTPNGTKIKIICGEVMGTRGPVGDIVIEPEYLDIAIPPSSEYVHPTTPGHTVFAYIIDGDGFFAQEQKAQTNHDLVLFTDGDHLIVSTQSSGVRFLLISGKPINEPVAWYGPIVMNTQAELKQAFAEYNDGTFIKHKKID
jgi:quercetin 2,3-dioxygenase